MRLVALFLVTSISASSFASFELLLVGDNGNNTTATRKIHRFDGDSGVYLGAFGAYNTDIRAIARRPGTNQLFTLTTTHLFIQNFNTGELINDFAVNATSLAFHPTNNFLYFTNSTTTITRASLMTIDSGTLSSSNVLTDAGATSINSVGFTSTGIMMTAQQRGGFPTVYSYSTSLVGFNSATLLAGVPLGLVSRSSSGGAEVPYTFGGLGRFGRYNSFGQSNAVISSTTLSTGVAMAPGHVGSYLVGKDVTNPALGLVTRYSASGAEMQSFGNSVLRSPVAMASVVAPEPGTMAIVGLGLAALKLRRKRS